MRIAQIAPPFETVPPVGYGGTERVVSTLAEELVRRGHDVTLFASGDSRTSARLVPTVDRALWRREPRYEDLAPFWSVTLGRVLRHADEFDVVHSHLDVFGLPLCRAGLGPVVTTMHGRLDLPELLPVFEEFHDAPVVSISDAQRRPLPAARWIATVHNGIDLDQFTPRAEPGQYLAFLGRVSRAKGLHLAIQVARKARMPIKVAARLPLPFSLLADWRADHEYYEHEVKPLLASADVEFVGEIGGPEKDAFLGGAAALLFPIQWPEPFGLVMPEAMACGTPVVALRNGSVPEVVRHGVTGFVCDSVDEMVEAVARIGQIDRRACREDVERRFSPSAMADGYEAVYRELAENPLPPELFGGSTLIGQSLVEA